MLHSSFATKELQKPIYIRRKLKNKMDENPSRENVLAYKKQRNIMLVVTQKIFQKAFGKHHGKRNKRGRTFCQLLVTSYQSLFTRHQLLDTSYSSLVTISRIWMLVTSCWLLIISNQLLVDEIYEISKPFSKAIDFQWLCDDIISKTHFRKKLF